MLEGADEKIRRYKEIKLEMEALKTEAGSIEADFLRAMSADLEDTKYKSVSWTDSEGNKVTATDAASLKIVYPTFLKKIFGEAYKDVVTEETTYKVSAGAARMLTALYSREFIRDSDLGSLIDTLGLDGKSAKALLKKLKGKRFETDVKTLMTVAGLDEDEAKENAYLAAEIVVWNDFMKLMELSKADIDQALEWIDGAITVEHTPKIRIDIA
ncbi:MAG: hypothetical protein IJ737_08155 [Ruminococcus sp.]|nr:hypothetical protein [Ruminococcus sp.]